MGLIKCPRCELNYMLDTDKMCSVCRRESRGASESFELIEMCSECGENPVVPGQEYCAYCLKQMSQHSTDESSDDLVPNTANIEGGSVSDMDEIELDLDNDMAGERYDDDYNGDDDEDKDDDEEEE